MTDILIAMAVMAGISLAAGVFVATIAWSAKGQRNMGALAVSVVAAIYFLIYGAGQLRWAQFVPVSAAIIYTNLASVFAALAAGWALRLSNVPVARRALMSICLSAMSLTVILWPLLSMFLRPPPEGADRWQGPVAMQTSWATCSPAAAATLIRAEGIPVNESEMIPLCLTDQAGTPTLGLYRGIKLVASRNGRDVEVTESSLNELMQADDWPVLLAVKLPYGIDDRRYADQWGWIPGMGHSVVIFRRTEDGGFLVGDPSAGLELWSEEDMSILWHGDGIRVVQEGVIYAEGSAPHGSI